MKHDVHHAAELAFGERSHRLREFGGMVSRPPVCTLRVDRSSRDAASACLSIARRRAGRWLVAPGGFRAKKIRQAARVIQRVFARRLNRRAQLFDRWPRRRHEGQRLGPEDSACIARVPFWGSAVSAYVRARAGPGGLARAGAPTVQLLTDASVRGRGAVETIWPGTNLVLPSWRCLRARLISTLRWRCRTGFRERRRTNRLRRPGPW